MIYGLTLIVTALGVYAITSIWCYSYIARSLRAFVNSLLPTDYDFAGCFMCSGVWITFSYTIILTPFSALEPLRVLLTSLNQPLTLALFNEVREPLQVLERAVAPLRTAVAVYGLAYLFRRLEHE